MSNSASYVSAANDVIERLRSLHDRPSSDGEGVDPKVKSDLIARVERAAARVQSGEMPDGAASAETLVRILVDGNGPRDPRHTLFSAIDRLEEARRALGEPPPALLPRAAVRSLREHGGVASVKEIQDLGKWSVLTPTTSTSSGTHLVQLETTDGRRLVVGFTARDLFDMWADSAEGSVSATLARLDQLGGLLGEESAGIALNPNENVLLPRDAFTRDQESLPAGTDLSFGAAAHMSGEMLQAVIAAAQATSEVSRVFALSIVEGDLRQRVVWIVEHSGDERVLEKLAETLSQRLGDATSLDLLDARTALAQTMIARVRPIYERE